MFLLYKTYSYNLRGEFTMPLNDQELNAQFEELKKLIREVDNISTQQRVGPNPYAQITEKEREQQHSQQNELNQKGLAAMVKAEKLYQKHYQDLINAGKIKSPEEMPTIFANIKFEKELRERINPNQIPNLNFETVSNFSSAESEASARSDSSARTATTVARTPKQESPKESKPQFVNPQIAQMEALKRGEKPIHSNQIQGLNISPRPSVQEQSQISSDKKPGLIQRILNKIKDSFNNIASTVTSSSKQDSIRSGKSSLSSDSSKEQAAVIISSNPIVIPKSTKSSEHIGQVSQQSQTDNPYTDKPGVDSGRSSSPKMKR